MTVTVDRRSTRPAFAGLAALLLLNGALTFDNAWPTPGIVPDWKLSAEAAGLLGLLAVWAARRRPAGKQATGGEAVGGQALRGEAIGERAASRRAMADGAISNGAISLLAALLTVMAVLRYLDVTIPALFGRPINLFWDGRHLPQVIVMAADGHPWWRLALIGSVALLAVGAVAWLLHRGAAWSLRRLSVWLQSVTVRRIAIAGSMIVLGVFATGRMKESDAINQWFAEPVSAAFGGQLLFLAQALSPQTDRVLPASPAFDGDLAALRGADVLVLFLESYGAVTVDDPVLQRRLAPARDELARAIGTTGRHVASAYVRSPTFAGGSWLAHASLLSGLQMAEPVHYHLLLTTQRPTMVGHFRRNGYRTVALMPGLRSPWPEGAFYGFDRIIDAAALDYRGPAFGFWRIPDQYSIARLAGEELAPAVGENRASVAGGGPTPAASRLPRLIVFPTITSHIPFRPLPPYAADWSRLFDEAPFDADAVARALQLEPDWVNPAPAYGDVIDYSLRWLAGFLRERASDPMLIVVIGDHQPAATVTGPRASWDVPVHLIARNPDWLAGFEEAGFRPGLAPPRAAIGPMSSLTTLLLNRFSQPGIDIAGPGRGVQPGEPLADAGRIEPAITGKKQRLSR